jgi:hypothetical protein
VGQVAAVGQLQAEQGFAGVHHGGQGGGVGLGTGVGLDVGVIRPEQG